MSIYAIPVSKQIITSTVLYIKGTSLEDAKNNLQIMFKDSCRSDVIEDYSKDNYDISSTPWEIVGK